MSDAQIEEEINAAKVREDRIALVVGPWGLLSHAVLTDSALTVSGRTRGR